MEIEQPGSLNVYDNSNAIERRTYICSGSETKVSVYLYPTRLLGMTRFSSSLTTLEESYTLPRNIKSLSVLV